MGLFSAMVENDPANVRVLNAKYHRIIEADIAANYAPGTVDVVATKHWFDLYKAHGGRYFASDKVLVIYREVDAGVEFHTANSGTGKELTECVVAFLHHVAPDYASACTYYDNDKISALFRFVPYRSAVERIDDGADRTYRATVYLRERI